jgi:uncharacterized protein (TIGR02246 family)
LKKGGKGEKRNAFVPIATFPNSDLKSKEEASMKSRILSITTAFAVLALLALSCAGLRAAGSAGDEAAIRAVFDKYVSTIETHDADGWMALWDEGGVQLPPDAPMHVGKTEIKKANYEEIKDSSANFSMGLQIQEVLIMSGGYGLARGVYHWTLTLKDGVVAAAYDGKFMTVLKKQSDGTWRIFRDCFNSNIPPK